MPKKSKTKKHRIRSIKEKISMILTTRKGNLYYKTKEKERAKQIKPKNKQEKKELDTAVKQMEEKGISKIQVTSSIKIDKKSTGCPGAKIRSKGKGQGLGKGNKKGPMGRMRK